MSHLGSLPRRDYLYYDMCYVLFENTELLCPLPSAFFNKSMASLLRLLKFPISTTGSVAGGLSTVKLRKELILVRDFSKKSHDANGDDLKITVNQQSIDAYLDEQTKAKAGQNNIDAESIDRSRFTKPILMKYPDIGGGNGKIKEWMKEEGDLVRAGDMLCDIETELFTFGMEIDDEGVGILKEKKVNEGEEFEPGTTICVLMHEDDSTS